MSYLLGPIPPHILEMSYLPSTDRFLKLGSVLYPTAAEMLAVYAECVEFVQEVLAALGMAEALHTAGMWDTPPHESWANVMAAGPCTTGPLYLLL